MNLAPRPIAFAALIPLVAGCGQPLADGTYRPPLVTLTATAPMALPTQTRLGILWGVENVPWMESDCKYRLLESRGGRPRFELFVAEPPPPGAIQAPEQATRLLYGGVNGDAEIDPQLRFAIGQLIAWIDVNGNGVLDFVKEGTSQDQIVAASVTEIFYLASGQPAPPARAADFPVTAGRGGYSVVQPPSRQDPLPSQCTEEAGCHFEDGPANPLPFDQNIELAVSDQVEWLTCNDFAGLGESEDDARFDEAIKAGDTVTIDRLTCDAANTAWVRKRCVDSSAWCSSRYCRFDHGRRSAAAPPPAGWPCP